MSEGETESYAALANQSLRRPLSAAERALANALENIFASAEHDFVRVAAALQERGVPRPSGSSDPWTVQTLEAELLKVNESLDRAYEEQSAGTESGAAPPASDAAGEPVEARR